MIHNCPEYEGEEGATGNDESGKEMCENIGHVRKHEALAASHYMQQGERSGQVQG